MNEIDVKLLNLKAALWESGDVNLLISKAIKAYQDKMCFPKADSVLYVRDQQVLVKGVPHIEVNNQLHENFLLMAALEDVIELKYEAPPQSLEFCSLLG